MRGLRLKSFFFPACFPMNRHDVVFKKCLACMRQGLYSSVYKLAHAESFAALESSSSPVLSGKPTLFRCNFFYLFQFFTETKIMVTASGEIPTKVGDQSVLFDYMLRHAWITFPSPSKHRARLWSALNLTQFLPKKFHYSSERLKKWWGYLSCCYYCCCCYLFFPMRAPNMRHRSNQSISKWTRGRGGLSLVTAGPFLLLQLVWIPQQIRHSDSKAIQY